jgi:cytosine/adenosine deaminase-related metal-dependent hydrolase
MALAERAEAIGWTSRAMLQQCVEGGAAALSLDESVGYLQQGYAADLIVVEGSTDCDDPHSAVLEASAKRVVRDVLVDGVPRVRGGCLLPSQSPESIVAAVAQIVASLGA